MKLGKNLNEGPTRSTKSGAALDLARMQAAPSRDDVAAIVASLHDWAAREQEEVVWQAEEEKNEEQAEQEEEDGDRAVAGAKKEDNRAKTKHCKSSSSSSTSEQEYPPLRWTPGVGCSGGPPDEQFSSSSD